MSEFITTYTGKHFKPTDPNPEPDRYTGYCPCIVVDLSGKRPCKDLLVSGTALYLLCERSGGKGTV